MQRLFKQFSFPGGIPSHVAAETPGSINEGGELGYCLSHAYGAAFDNPDLIVACVVGDGEAETGALAASWQSNKFLNPAVDGAVLPILHLNGYKIANPTVLARIDREELADYLRGCGYTPYFVEGDDPATMHQLMAATLDRVLDEIKEFQQRARVGGHHRAPGLAGDRAGHAQGLDRAEDRGRAADRGDVPVAPGALLGHDRRAHHSCSKTGCAATSPRSCSTRPGAFRPELAELAPAGHPAHGRQPARQRRAAAARPRAARLPRLRRGRAGARGRHRARRPRSWATSWPRSCASTSTPSDFRLFGPDETVSNRLGRGARGHPAHLERHDPPRRRPPLADRPGDGDPERAHHPGLGGGLPADRAARLLLLLRGLHPHRRLDVQPARQVAGRVRGDPLAAAGRLAQLPAHLARLAAGPQRLLPPGPGLHRPRAHQEGVGHARLPAARRQHACSTSPTSACAAGTSST